MRIQRKLTKNYKEVPLFWVTFDYLKYLNEGEKGSCEVRCLPDFMGDDKLKDMLNDVIDYIRSDYDMGQIAVTISDRVQKK